MSVSRRWVVVFLVPVAWAALISAAFAEQKSVALPKGTHVERVSSGHFRFWLPDGKIVQVKEYNPETGNIVDVGVFDSVGTRTVAGEKANLKHAGKLSKEDATKLLTADYVEIDDTLIRLPATVEYRVKVDPPPASTENPAANNDAASPKTGQPAATPKAPGAP
jgi:hypothetical protein